MLMEIAKTTTEVRNRLSEARSQGRAVVLVPTMGALHAGHMTLVTEARSDSAAFVVVSIFVNPTQFAPGEDLDAYPRTLEVDAEQCSAAGVDLIYAPSSDAMYAEDASTVVRVGGLDENLCGPYRPGHFEGVATVVCKLLNMVEPERAIFGEKDFQQLQIIRRMVRDLDLPVEVVGVPTVREPDGLAMSSRNVYLSPSERQQAKSVYAALRLAAERVKAGERDVSVLESAMRDVLLSAGPVDIDYVQIVDQNSLRLLDIIEGPAQAAIAVRIGATRLIDNLEL